VLTTIRSVVSAAGPPLLHEIGYTQDKVTDHDGRIVTIDTGRVTTILGYPASMIAQAG
jgi:hypothetical protein